MILGYQMRYKKVLLSFFIILLNVFILISLAGCGNFASPHQTLEDMEYDFHVNNVHLLAVVEYLINVGYDRITVRPIGRDVRRSHVDEIELFMFETRSWIPVDNKEVCYSLNALFDAGYQSITKSENFIRFVRWAGLDVGRGLVYSIDGSIPDETDIQFLTFIEPISEPRWFFYVSDFNEWRSR